MKKISKKSKVLCAFCHGKGTQRGDMRLLCMVCKGGGRIVIQQPYTVCKECAGKGKKMGTNLYCMRCRGKGVVEERNTMTASKKIAKVAKVSKRRIEKPLKRGGSIIRKTKRTTGKEKESFLKGFLRTIRVF